ncbi:hypothetical protein GCM10028805_33700 [Spirosoma harenae]
MSDNVFNENAGRFLRSRESRAMKEAYRNAKLACGQKEEEYTRSEFFGIAKINQLLKQKGCVGIRVHYANRWEDDNERPTEVGKGQLKARVLLTGVDVRGRDLPSSVSDGGLKDDGGNEDMTLGEGWTCPRHCADNQ